MVHVSFRTTWTVLIVLIYLSLRASSGKTFTWREWWKNTVIYQIYPFSYADSNGDGYGDLNGIRSRLDYLVDIGINTVWLTPVTESPMKDFGYDISNYTNIDPLFGTLEDFDRLIREMHDKGIRLLLDFVPNHTSDQHKWFQESKKSKDVTNAYRDYYVWKDPKPDCQDPDKNNASDVCKPNNWVSRFGGSSWTWVPERQQYYYHQFLKKQPDLNYRNPQVLEEIKNVLRFWFDRGVDGFRVDAIRYLFEDESLLDDPIDPGFIPPPNMTKPLYKSLQHRYTADLTGVHTVVKSWRSEVFEAYSTPPNYRFMGTQSYGNAKTLSLYYGTEDEPEADFPFNFQFIKLTQESLSGFEVHRLIDDWLFGIPPGAWPNWVFSHHGKNRISDRFGLANHRAALLLNLLLPGTPHVYYGEEIGMANIDIKFEDQQDCWGRNNPCCWKKLNRDQHRSPMQWNRESNAGFSTANKTWLPVHENYLHGVNAQTQMYDESSTLSLFRKLIKLRYTTPALQTNSITYSLITQDIFSFLRIPDQEDSGSPSILVAINFSNKTLEADLSTASLHSNDIVVFENNDGVVVTSSRLDQDRNRVDLTNVMLRPHEALVIRVSLHTGHRWSGQEIYWTLISVCIPVGLYFIITRIERTKTD